MAQKAIADLSEDFLQCSICMNQYNKPLMLPCVHSFCSRCLEEYERNRQHQPFSCPTCRRIVDLPRNGVKDLPNNFFLTNLMERLEVVEKLSKQSQIAQCIFCKKDFDISFCIDCKIHLCQNCKQTHSRLPGSTDHTIIPAGKLSDANYLKKVTSARAPQCNKHPKENMRFYCTTCNQLVCRDCTILSHREHECVEAESKITSTKKRLETLLEKSGNYILDGLKYAKKIEKADKKLEENKLTVRNQIDDCYNEIVAKLQANKNKLYEELEEEIGEKRTPLQQKNVENQNWMKAMENTQEITRRILEGDNPWEMLGMERDLENSIDTLQSDPPPKEYDEIEDIIGSTLQFEPVDCTIYEDEKTTIGRIREPTTLTQGVVLKIYPTPKDIRQAFLPHSHRNFWD
ncbi:E3 ubiquitin-protein ligase TRIM56 [Holothuria leucospilota]|uniref:E3 ubiquitin-protein ligase TRIM56 n=1 Tax=Holothuria leucospilota TaxID=206669 RepID=A0A9Q1CD38_HOLLE|nr:E3 ubiquitin-protein ligase TRIM56 [Holothuria leucospilota]